MNNEIKEILDELRDKDCYINNETTLTFDEAKDILDYITNLQEENGKLKYSLMNRIKQSDMMDEYIKRIDEALEYIDNHNKLEQELGGTIRFNLVKLEKILKGEDK